jgi:hypothetical protein
MVRYSSIVLLMAGALLAGCGGPLGPLPGGKLSGQEVPVLDGWAGVTTADGIALETVDGQGKPHSVNTWATIIDGAFYVPTSLILGAEDPNEREWVRNVLANPMVRVRSGERVYPGAMRRVTDAALAAAAKAQLLAAYEEAPTEHSEAAWVFQVVAR